MYMEAKHAVKMVPAPNNDNLRMSIERDIRSKAPSKSIAMMNNFSLYFFACLIGCLPVSRNKPIFETAQKNEVK